MIAGLLVRAFTLDVEAASSPLMSLFALELRNKENCLNFESHAQLVIRDARWNVRWLCHGMADGDGDRINGM
jgi:hypothetical protein